MMPILCNTTQTFYDARGLARWTRLFDLVRRKSSDMFGFDVVRSGLYVRGQHELGLQTVPLAHIIGSEGRYRDFDRRFLPQTDVVKERWTNIERAVAQGICLPPIRLYKISGVYFVCDGNHRVSVARYHRWVDIEAFVTELLVDVVLTPTLSTYTLLLQQERSDFLEWTNLRVLRPHEQVECRDLGGYLEFVRQINAHRNAMTEAQQRKISRDEAVADWYDMVYLPSIRL